MARLANAFPGDSAISYSCYSASKLILLKARLLRLLNRLFNVAMLVHAMSKSIFFTAGYAIRTSTKCVTNGTTPSGSIIGGIQETQEMLDFCADHGITADIELIKIQQINDAYERLLKSDVKYRFVIDMASLKA
jgi:hypothetical protein